MSHDPPCRLIKCSLKWGGFLLEKYFIILRVVYCHKTIENWGDPKPPLGEFCVKQIFPNL